MDDDKTHWERVYEQKPPEAVSWYAPHLTASLAYIRKAGMPLSARILDVGGGESTLVDDLVEAGHPDVTVLDISARALEVARRRMGAAAQSVTWLEADVLEHRFPQAAYDIWHDRAVFHFMADQDRRERYVRQVLHALRPGGFAIVGAFGPQGPLQCSGLPVARYGADQLHDAFGDRFQLIEHAVDLHTTPWGTPQQFVYCFCRREH